LAVDECGLATRLGTPRAGIDLAVVAAEIARADGCLSGRAARIGAGRVGRERGHRAALTVDLDARRRTGATGAGGYIAHLIGRATARRRPRYTGWRARWRARRRASARRHLSLPDRTTARWRLRRGSLGMGRAGPRNRDIAHVPAGRFVFVFLDVVYEVACKWRLVIASDEPGAIAL
jgi:hypothetical protein